MDTLKHQIESDDLNSTSLLTRVFIEELLSPPFSISCTHIVVLILCIAWALEPLFEKRPAVTNAVYHGYSSWLEPTRFLRARFIFNARKLIASGSLKVSSAKCNVVSP
jgi:hypothetical protein